MTIPASQTRSVVYAVDDVIPATEPLPVDVVDHGVKGLLGQSPFVTPLPEIEVVKGVDYHPLMAAVFLAYSQHRPLVLSPDMIWIAIAQGAALHINNHPEELRPLLVKHQGHETIEIERETHEPTSAVWWEENISELRLKLRDRVNPQVRDLLLCEFSTTGEIERTVGEIVMLDALKSYFDCVIRCICGIPWIELEGTAEDWIKLRAKIEGLEYLQLGWWLEHLRPICDEFVNFSQGQPNLEHWQSICKLKEAYGYTEINGWLPKLMPYVKLQKGGEARHISPIFTGKSITSDHLPSGISEVPFTLGFGREEAEVSFNLKLIGGFFGVTQAPSTHALRPLLAWGVSSSGTVCDSALRIVREHRPRFPGAKFSLQNPYLQFGEFPAFYEAMDGAKLFASGREAAFDLLPVADLAPVLHRDMIETLPEAEQPLGHEWSQMYIFCRNADGTSFAFLNSLKEVGGRPYLPFYHLTGSDVRPGLQLVATSLGEFLNKLLESNGKIEAVLAEQEADVIARLEENQF